ncbi:MAG TPA: ATPase domain-containing protein [Chthoniobacterales bacterium]|jgi:circadian clock protein KaiC
MKKNGGRERGRSATGISGLDDILGGGLPSNRLYLLEGKPGTGKTTLALEYLLTGAEAGEKVLYITLSETRDELQEVADSHGWSLEGINVVELSAIGAQLEAAAQNTLFHSSEVELTQTTKMLLDEVERVQPSRVVFDSISELRLLSQSPLRYRRQILALKQYFAGRKCTTLLLDDGSAEEDPQLKSLAHGILMLEQLAPQYGSERRRLMVLKIRGSKYRGGYHDFSIETGGISVFPRLVAAEHRRDFEHDSLSSGIKGLDDLLGGGLTRGTSNLFIGPAGSGKSTIAMKFLLEAAKRGEKSAIYSFDETLGTVLARANKLGLGLQERIGEGLIQVHQVDPAEMSPGEFAFAIKSAVERDNIGILQIDSLNGFLHAMGDERFLNLQLHELVTYLNQQGIVTIMMLAPHGMLGQMRTPLDVTYLADTVVALRYYEAGGSVHKAISVIKKRTGKHERTIREVNMDRGKISVGRPLTKFRGIFTGTPQTESSSRSKRDHESV